MATYRHDPKGSWFAAIRGGVILFVPSAASGELGALWAEFADGDPTSRVLDRLTAQGLAATPSFALVVRDREAGSARIVVRGPITVDVGDIEINGTGVSTWIERVVADAATVRVAVDAIGDAESVAGEALPVVEAVVAALAVSSGGVESVAPDEPREQAAAAAPAVGAPAARPAAVPEVRAPSAPLLPPAPPPAAPNRAPAEQTMVPAEETVASVHPTARPTAPSAPATATAQAAAPTGDADGDHDGMTVASVDIRRLREARARTAPETPANGTPAASAAASPISIRLPDGSVEPIAQEVVLGRAPSVSKVSGGRIPRLVTIGLGDPDISRSHARLALEGDTVVVTDLHSRNGTHVAQPGKAPVKLRAGEPTPVLAGTVVDFGGGWTIQVVAD
ncbi:FHA domain-containing protein [Agromyces ramosus]|uniref:FHA domain-containing protein n=1 Tax=Agromyces ramosus TaxID=33879 RepID=A0ABU0R3P4_9MICO|nr:FHA domain-containing protein [Agromyces ramosus]MDQ0892693.1 hypothetical protein [Agromyces ramosus]